MTQNSTKNPVVQVSGRGTNVEFIIDDVSPFDQITKGIRDYLVENRGMWSGGAIAVNVGSRLTSRDQLNEIKNIIESGSGLTVVRFSCSPETMAPPPSVPDPVRPLQHNAVIIPDRKPTVAPAPPVKPAAAPTAFNEAPRQTVLPIEEVSQVLQPSQTPRQQNAVMPEPPHVQYEPRASVEAEQPLLMDEERANLKRPSYLQSQRDTALLVKSTCRSGEIIRHQGDVVVLGDVNPGAEVVASGDIVVFGCLRGFAHAGSEGDTKATIVTLSLGSPRVQIGPHVGVSSGNNVHPKYTDSGPVIAYVRRRSIHVALFEGRFFKYGKGELYDG